MPPCAEGMDPERKEDGKMEYDSFSPQETFCIACELGKRTKEGTVICLTGDLGVGKTLFAQGFAKGLGIEEGVNSPTFTVVQEYDEGRLPFYHFDVYRIEDPQEMEEIGFTEMIYGDGACLIEWAEQIRELLPEHYTRVTIRKQLEKGWDYRCIRIESI